LPRLSQDPSVIGSSPAELRKTEGEPARASFDPVQPPVTTEPVLVTGASGYLGCEIVGQLLARGYDVRGTTRDVAKAKADGYVTGLDGASDRLRLFEAELMSPGAYDAAVEGCERVIHLASPFAVTVGDPQRDLVDPAVEGSISVLEAAARTGTVKRVVLTSSMAAITDSPDGTVISEEIWNTQSSLTRNPYYYSKAEAERAAWGFVEHANPGFDLVVTNPAYALGPSLIPSLNESSRWLVSLTNGETPAILDLQLPAVDVRDVAEAHIRAMESPSASGRYLLLAGVRSSRQVVDLLREHGWGDRYRLPSLPLDNRVGNLVVRIAANLRPAGTRSYLKTHLGGDFKFDSSKAERELGISYRDVDQTILDAMDDLERWGHLGKK
jgi:dihydroflavonol-4-reductase